MGDFRLLWRILQAIRKHYCPPRTFAYGSFTEMSAAWAKDGVADAFKQFKKLYLSEVSWITLMSEHIASHLGKSFVD